MSGEGLIRIFPVQKRETAVTVFSKKTMGGKVQDVIICFVMMSGGRPTCSFIIEETCIKEETEMWRLPYRLGNYGNVLVFESLSLFLRTSRFHSSSIEFLNFPSSLRG